MTHELCLAGAIMVPLSRAVNQGGLTRQLWRRLGIWSRAPLNKPAACSGELSNACTVHTARGAK
jgi:hypothetical protein